MEMNRSQRTGRVILCTAIGLAAGALLLHFAGRMIDKTAAMWIDRLFSFAHADVWILLLILGVIPLVTGIVVGLRGEGIGSILKLPFLALYLGVLTLLLLGLVILVVWAIQTGAIWTYIACALAIAAALSAAQKITIVVFAWAFTG